MKLIGITLFGVGYVLGSKAGRERYEQIRALARATSEKFEDAGTQSRLSAYTERLSTYARPTDMVPHSGSAAGNGTRTRVNARNV
ncbi:MAG: hypothetical protein ABI586_04165 [Candidatus Nanopelagicales bacterium]